MNSLLIYTTEVTARLQYTFNLMLTDLLSLNYEFTSDTAKFEAHQGPKFSYARKPLGNELFFESARLLFESTLRHQPLSVVQQGNIQGFYPTAKAALPFDIFASAFFMVSRYDEYFTFKPDKYNRYRASQSISYKLGILKKPVVNYYALALEELLLEKFPQLITKRHPFKYIATVDVDMAYSYLHKGFKRGAGGFIRSLMFSDFKDIRRRLSVFVGRCKDPFDSFEYIFKVLNKFHIPTQFFFLLGNPSRFDKNIVHTNPAFRQLIKDVADKCDVGIHLSFKSHLSSDLMKEEIERLEEITGKKITENRFHYLRFTLPRSYNRLIKLGITDDHSMGYAPHAGFRAGICTPHYFFNLEANEVTTLKVHPIAFMDTTFAHYKKDIPADALEKIQEIMDYVKETGGTCVGLWHNSSFSEIAEWKGWKHVFESTAMHASLLTEENGRNTLAAKARN